MTSCFGSDIYRDYVTYAAVAFGNSETEYR